MIFEKIKNIKKHWKELNKNFTEELNSNDIIDDIISEYYNISSSEKKKWEDLKIALKFSQKVEKN